MDGSSVVEEVDEVDDDDANAVAPQPAPATRTMRASKMPRRAGLLRAEQQLGGVMLEAVPVLSTTRNGGKMRG